jgi:hypothetical protein
MAVNNLNVPGVGIQPSLIDAKGDLLVGTGNDAIDRLGVTGPTGSVLVTDAGETTGLKWVDPGTVGGLVHIETVTFTGIASVNADDVFNSVFDSYRIIYNVTPSTTPTAFIIRLRDSGSTITTSVYRKQNLTASSTTVTGARVTGATSWDMTTPSTTSEQVILDLSNPTTQGAGIMTQHSRSSGTGLVIEQSVVNVGAGNPADGIQFAFTGGATMAGTLSVYGYRK